MNELYDRMIFLFYKANIKKQQLVFQISLT